MKILACYSNKGGVGKTAAAVNLAYAFAQSGKRTLLCDLDPQGAASFYFRVKPAKKQTEAALFEDSENFLKAIRDSEYENLDVLPASASFRDFDLLLAGMRKSRSQLNKALKGVKKDYDVAVLDCPPNLSLLSENVFRAADLVLAPVVPTTLSERAFRQLEALFREDELPPEKLCAFFSMVQSVKTLHVETMAALRAAFGGRILEAAIPFASDVERMGVRPAPVLASAPASPSARAYQALHREASARLDRT